jgi:hypothetical protein
MSSPPALNFSTGQQESEDCRQRQSTTGAGGDVAPWDRRHAVFVTERDATIDRGEPVLGGLRPFQRRSFLRSVAGGVAGAVAAGSVAPGVVQAATQDDYNMEATQDGLRAVPFYGRNQAGIATAPQTVASFLAFDVTAANRGELTALFRALSARCVPDCGRHSAAESPRPSPWVPTARTPSMRQPPATSSPSPTRERTHCPFSTHTLNVVTTVRTGNSPYDVAALPGHDR